jgi:hypothetical protein
MTAPGIPNGTRYLCPLCDWWLDVPPLPPDRRDYDGMWIVTVQNTAAIEGALVGHFATTRHRGMGYGWGPWTAETLQPCSCGHPRGDHLRHASVCLYSTDSETWACDCDGFALSTAVDAPGESGKLDG